MSDGGPTDELAAVYAESLSELERRLIVLCSRSRTPSYRALAQALDVSYEHIQGAAGRLRAWGFATMEPLRDRVGLSGTGLFLNEKGEAVRRAVIARQN